MVAADLRIWCCTAAEKNVFYEQLYAIRERLPTNVIVSMMADLHAKVGFGKTLLGQVSFD